MTDQSQREVCYDPIGVVRGPVTDPGEVPRPSDETVDARGRIELDASLEQGLAGLSGFSHVLVLAHLHEVEGYDLTCSPPFADVEPGVFATRSPRRPNPIAASILRLDAVEETTLRVRDLDLVDGTPVLDVKPFAPKPEEIADIRAGWLEEANRETGHEPPQSN